MKFISHAGKRTWRQVIDDKWWANQRAALDRMDAYLAANSDRQAMVRMPTGTGKTAVIATLAQLRLPKKELPIYGGTVGAGVELTLKHLKIAPTVRYTRWGPDRPLAAWVIRESDATGFGCWSAYRFDLA